MTTKIPSIPEYNGSNLDQVISALKEATEVRIGQRGDNLDAGVTFRDLESLQLATSRSSTSSSLTPITLSSGITFYAPSGDKSPLYDPTTDLATPPSPTNLEASSVFETVFLSWSQSAFSNQSYWEIYRSFVDDLSQAQLVGTSTAQSYVDRTLNPPKTFYYWVRTVSAANVRSAWNSTTGTTVTTGVSPELLMAAVEGQILESSLSQYLSERISDAVDGSISAAHKVVAEARARINAINQEVRDRIAQVEEEAAFSASALAVAVQQEASARSQAIALEAGTRAAAILAEATTRNSQITTETITRQTETESLAQANVLTTASLAANAAAIQQESLARADADSVTTSLVTTLASQVSNANYATQAWVQQGYYTKTDSESAYATINQALSSTFDNKLTGYVPTATLTNDYYTKATTDSAIAASSLNLVTNNGLNNALNGFVTSSSLASNYYTKSETDAAISYAGLNLVSNGGLNAALNGYVNIATLSADYYTKADTDSAISVATLSLVSLGGLNEALGGYVNTSFLANNYYTKSDTDAAISIAKLDLVSNGGLSAALGGYVTNSTLANTYYTKADTDSAISAATLNLVSNGGLSNTLNGYVNNSTLANNYYTKADTDSAISAATLNLVSNTGLNNALTGYVSNAALTNGYYTKSATDSAIATATSNLVSSTTFENAVGSFVNDATLTTNYYTRTDTNSAISTAVQTLRSSINNTVYSLPFDQWNLANNAIVTITDGKVGSKALRLTHTGGYPNQGTFIAIDASKKYRVKFWARPSADANGLLYFSLRQFVSESQPGPGNNGRSPYKPSGFSKQSHINAYGSTAWGQYVYDWTSANWQTGVTLFQPEFLNNYSGSTGYWEIQDFQIFDATDTVALEVNATTQGSEIDGLQGQYTVKIDNAGHVSGFGLASTTVSGTPSSAFIVRADKFAIVDPASTANNLTNDPSANAVPFAVVGGNTYIKTAFIQDASITDAKITNLTASKITAGYVNAAIGVNGGKVYGAELYAGGTTTVNTDGSGNVTGFTANNPTVKIASGNAEFVVDNFAIKQLATSTSTTTPFEVVSNQVRIKTALIGDATIGFAKIADDIQSTNYSAGTAGWKIAKDGSAEFGASSIRGQLTASQIDSRGLSIKDTNGNTILEAGASPSISNSYVSGLGSFATLSQITSSNISTYIASAAIDSAYIANAAITSALIGDAEIGTLKIANQAVTVPAGTELASQFSLVWLGGSVESGNIMSVSVDSGGQPVWITFTIQVNWATEGGYEYLRLYNNTTLVKQWDYYIAGPNPLYVTVSKYLASPGTGSRTYAVRASKSVWSGSNASAGATMFAIGTKR